MATRLWETGGGCGPGRGPQAPLPLPRPPPWGASPAHLWSGQCQVCVLCAPPNGHHSFDTARDRDVHPRIRDSRWEWPCRPGAALCAGPPSRGLLCASSRRALTPLSAPPGRLTLPPRGLRLYRAALARLPRRVLGKGWERGAARVPRGTGGKSVLNEAPRRGRGDRRQKQKMNGGVLNGEFSHHEKSQRHFGPRRWTASSFWKRPGHPAHVSPSAGASGSLPPCSTTGPSDTPLRSPSQLPLPATGPSPPSSDMIFSLLLSRS